MATLTDHLIQISFFLILKMDFSHQVPLSVFRVSSCDVFSIFVKSSSNCLDQLRQLEIEMNQAFDQYRELYYDGGVCSVYLWETGKDNTSSFAGSILFKKAGDGSQKIKGCWDSIHIFEVRCTIRQSRSKVFT